MKTEIYHDLLKIAPDISDKLIDGFQTLSGHDTHNKLQDLATNLDHEIGAYVISQISKKYPEIRIDSEEIEERIGTGKLILRLDPLDGTKHAVNGIDLISSVMSLSQGGQVLFALVINPFSNKIYHAIKGRGAFLNGSKIKVNTEPIESSFVFIEQPSSKLFHQDNDQFLKFSKLVEGLSSRAFRTRNIGLASLSLGFVSQGASCAYIDFSGTTKLYDIEGPLFIAQEAGAVAGDFTGNKISVLSYDRDSEKKEIDHGIIVANPKSYDEIVKLFNAI